MTYAIIVGATLLLLIGATFFWLNLNSPVQTRIPAVALPVGVVLMVIGLTLALSGCSTPSVRDRIVEVDKPVAVQPIRADQIPALPAPLPKRPANVSSALDLALAQVCAFVGYALKADPLLRVSAGLPPREVPKFPECER